MVASPAAPRVPDDVRVVEQRWRSDGAARGTAGARSAGLADRRGAVRRAARHHPSDRLRRRRCNLPRGTVSSHGFGVAEAIALARALGTLPQHCIVYAIEAADFTPGSRPTPEVTAAAGEVTRRILEELHT